MCDLAFPLQFSEKLFLDNLVSVIYIWETKNNENSFLIIFEGSCKSKLTIKNFSILYKINSLLCLKYHKIKNELRNNRGR